MLASSLHGRGASSGARNLRPKQRTGGNSTGYSNPELDALIDSGNSEIDPEKRAEIYKKAQAIVNADVPWIFLWLPQDIYGVSDRLKGWRPSADSRINLHDAYVE